MRSFFGVLMLLTLAGCTAAPPRASAISPCAAGEASYACQVERYNNVATQ